MIIKVKNIIFRIMYILILIYLCIFFPSFFGYKPLVVISGSMEPTLKVGGLLYYHKEDLSNFDNGDILVYKTKSHIISHRIMEHSKNGFITKGDANSSVDSLEVRDSQVLGKGTNWSIPFIGYYADFIYRHKYILFVAVTIVFIDLCNDAYGYYKRKVGVKVEKIE